MDYALVALLGTLVGVAEIASRYRDAPSRAVWNPAAAAYLAVNALAAVSALSLSRSFGLTFGGDAADEIRLLQVLVAGFAAVAILRTSLFVVRVGGRDIGVGPITLLQVLLFATDRDVDRRRAVKRAKIVSTALCDLTYEQARDALPEYCLTLMQNVSRDEEAELRQRVRETDQTRMADTLKVNALGLALMNIVGDKVLAAAAAAASSRVIHGGVLGEVYPRLREILRGSRGPGSRTLDVLGQTLHTAWPNIRQWIEDEPDLLAGWTIHLRVPDPELLANSSLTWFDERWGAEVRNVIADVDAYNRDRADALVRADTTIAITTYRMLPAVHGFRTSDGAYFLSVARWDPRTGLLGRPYQSYEYLAPGADDARTIQYKALFDNWLEQADNCTPNRVQDRASRMDSDELAEPDDVAQIHTAAS